ncbi:hypothetical protein OF83DRAFT_701330 [Amylostereum chailletii]|nr:hypothetical protein OF83DRAFT_701330 [Amylostereum chailletii]
MFAILWMTALRKGESGVEDLQASKTTILCIPYKEAQTVEDGFEELKAVVFVIPRRHWHRHHLQLLNLFVQWVAPCNAIQMDRVSRLAFYLQSEKGIKPPSGSGGRGPPQKQEELNSHSRILPLTAPTPRMILQRMTARNIARRPSTHSRTEANPTRRVGWMLKWTTATRRIWMKREPLALQNESVASGSGLSHKSVQCSEGIPTSPQRLASILRDLSHRSKERPINIPISCRQCAVPQEKLALSLSQLLHNMCKTRVNKIPPRAK